MSSWIKIQLRLLLMKLGLITCAAWHVIPSPANTPSVLRQFGSLSYSSDGDVTQIKPGLRPLPIP